MPVNAGHEFFEVEKKYLSARNPDEKIFWLEEMIRKAPKHKSSEKFVSELKIRLRKLRDKAETARKKGGSKKGIRKEGYQVLLIGKTNSGKSSLLGKLTNAKPKISGNMFSTKEAELGTMEYEGAKAQIIDMPSTGSEHFDYGILHGADCLLLVVDKLEDLEDLKPYAEKNRGHKLIVVNKIDMLDDNERRKLQERCKSKRLKDFVLVSCFEDEGILMLKKMIFEKMNVVRVYTKEPGKLASKEPMVLGERSSVKDAAEKILKGFSRQIKETRVTGPSAKFANQKVGLTHILKDGDVIEFHTR